MSRPKFSAAIMAVGALALLGCGRQPPASPTPPSIRPGAPAEFRIRNAQLLQAESWPVQVRLEVSGTLSSACHEIEARVIPPDDQGRIDVQVTEEPIEGEDCPPAAEAFRESIPIGSFTSGDYVVSLNGEPVGELQLGATPIPDDADFERGPVFVDGAELQIMESFPIQVSLAIRGSLPTPCHSLHWSSEPPDEQQQIHIEAYSLRDPAVDCIQVLEPVEATIPVGSFSQGAYTVWLNGELVGEFEP